MNKKLKEANIYLFKTEFYSVFYYIINYEKDKTKKEKRQKSQGYNFINCNDYNYIIYSV